MSAAEPSLRTALAAALEAAVNHALRLDPACLRRLAELEGAVLHCQCTRPELDLYLLPGETGLAFRAHWEAAAGQAGGQESKQAHETVTRIRGSAADYAALLKAADPVAELVNGGLELEGDSAPLLALRAIIKDLDLDWEAPLVDALGDVAGHQLAEALRAAAAWGKQAAAGIARQVDEFMREERR